jgi:hypothetical protein
MKKYLLAIMFLVLACSNTFSNEKSNSSRILIRPNIGYGEAKLLTEQQQKTAVQRIGTRILLNSSDKQFYGFEFSIIQPIEKEKMLNYDQLISFGIFLEQKMKNFLGLLENAVAGIGTIGYIGKNSELNNTFGLCTNIGSDFTCFSLNLNINLRTDYIFDSNTILIHSLSLGINL